jgi:hypothetical protein
MKLRFALLAMLVCGSAAAQQTPVGIGDLPAASFLNPTDMFIVCQSPPCHAGTQLNSATLSKLPLSGIPPITYNPTTGAIGLAIDSTLSVVGGQLHVVGGGVTVPNAALLSGNGTTIGGVTLGTNLSFSGSFPNQTLNASGGGTTIPNAALTSGNGSVLGGVALGTNLSLTGSFPTQTLNATGGGSGLSIGITLANACTGASCTPVISCATYTTGSLSNFASGACSGSSGSSLTGGGGSLTGGGGSLTGG